MKKLPVWCMIVMGCASVTGRAPAPDPPVEAARHRAALATVAVSNGTTSDLTIGYRSATPPVQEVIIGKVSGGTMLRLAPIPAGEPIVFFARRADGSELALPPRSFDIDVEWTWAIPHDATFTKPATGV